MKILHTQATQDNQTRSQTEGCVRLCSKFSQKRLQHPYRLYLVPGVTPIIDGDKEKSSNFVCGGFPNDDAGD